MTVSNKDREKPKVENKCKHDPSQWRSSNQLNPTICTVMLGRKTESDVRQAMEHFSQIGQCQCGKKVILCKFCPLSGDKLAGRLPKNCGQRTPNPIIFDNRATKNAIESHSNGAYHRYWKSIHDRMVSEGPIDLTEPLNDFPDCSSGSPSILESEISFPSPNSELFMNYSNQLQPFSESPMEEMIHDEHTSRCEQSGSVGMSPSNESQWLDGSVSESKNPTPNQEVESAEDAWFEMQAKVLREKNMKTAADIAWKSFSMDSTPVNGSARTSAHTGDHSYASDPTKILPSINLENDYMSFVKLHGLTNGWPDFVFQEDFIKPSLSEVVAYAKKHKHLPGVIPEKYINEGDFSCQREIASVLQYVEMLVLWAKELSDGNKLLEEQIDRFKKAHSTGDEKELMMKISRLLSNIVTKRCIQQLQLSRPQGGELLQWMRENGLICFARVFAKNGLHSLEHVANLDQQDCENLTVSLETLGSIGKRIELQIAVQNLQGDIRAKDMNFRLHRFSDCKIPLWSAWSSAAAVEILLTKFYVQIPLVFLGVFLVLRTLFAFASVCMPSYFRIASQHAPATMVMITDWPLHLVEGLLWLVTVYEARMKCPMAARNVALFNLKLTTYHLYLQTLLEVKDVMSSCSAQTCRWDGSRGEGLVQDLLVLPAISLISFGCSNLQPRLLLFLMIIGCYLLAVIAPIYWNLDRFKALLTVGVGAALLLMCASCKCFEWVVMKNQRKQQEEQVQLYKREWGSQVEIEGNKELIARLKYDADRINNVITEQYRSCFASATRTGNWRFRSLFAEPVGRFSFQGKVRQCTRDFGHLFSEASSINDHFHEFMSELLQKKFCGGIGLSKAAMRDDKKLRERLESLQSASMLGEVRVDGCDKMLFVRGPIKQPARAIQKCVRVYGRDSGCLTDLVRATVIVESLAQVEEILSFLERSSIVGVNRTLKELSEEAVRENADEVVFFRMTRVKNYFEDDRTDSDANLTLKMLSINLEIGWIFENDKCMVLPVEDWDLKTAETHICELQVHLLPLFDKHQEMMKFVIENRKALAR